jgi:hypothetical protein
MAVQVGGWTAAGIWVAALGFLGLLVRQVIPWKKIAADSEQAWRTELINRIDKLERRQERERARHNAERAIDRHRLNNVTACFDAMMLLLKTSPEKATEIVVQIEAMRARQREEEALEKSRIHAALIAATAEEGNSDDEEAGEA